MNLAIYKKMLEKRGETPENIEKLVAEYLEVEKEEQKSLENMLKVNDAAVYLEEQLQGMWNEAKVRRFIKDGEINPAGSWNAKKLGYRIEKSELDRFIEEYKMTKDDWKKLAKSLQKENETLKAEIESLKVKEVPVQQVVTEVPDGQLTIEEFSGVSEVGGEQTNQNLLPSVALEIPEKIKITGLKVGKAINEELFAIEFKFDGEDWSGRVEQNQKRDDVYFVFAESYNSSRKLTRDNDNELMDSIEKVLMDKGIMDKIAKKRPKSE